MTSRQYGIWAMAKQYQLHQAEKEYREMCDAFEGLPPVAEPERRKLAKRNAECHRQPSAKGRTK